MATSGTDDSGASESDDNEDHHSENMDEVCLEIVVLEMGCCSHFSFIFFFRKRGLRDLCLPFCPFLFYTSSDLFMYFPQISSRVCL